MTSTTTCIRLGSTVLLALLVASCGGGSAPLTPVGPPSPPPPPPTPSLVDYTEDRATCSEQDSLRRAFFGDLHMHTSYSMDAWTFGTTATPADAYRRALDLGLDFAAVTDHSEFLGELQLCLTPGSASFNAPLCVTLRDEALPQLERRLAFSLENLSLEPMRNSPVCGPNGQFCLTAALEQWERIQQQAQDFYDRSSGRCNFTTFMGYEWTGVLEGSVHRTVIFRNDDVLRIPVSHFESPRPEDLWQALDDQCRSGDRRCDVIAIPHNSNGGSGAMFRPEYFGATNIDEERGIAARRAAIEPLMEVFQHKGQSECIAGFTDAAGTVDELCNFENVSESEDGDRFQSSPEDMLRGALGTGLEELTRLGVNPFRMGVIASSDTHSGETDVEEDGYDGNLGPLDSSVGARLGNEINASYNPGGLAGVWAVDNSRDGLMDAMQRQETFGTSGPRITMRMFAGWELDPGACARPDRDAYLDGAGVPMGSDLPTPPAPDLAPVVAVWGLADQVPLQRLQIIKGWLDPVEGPQVRVYDVAGSADNGATVDTDTCQVFPAGSMDQCAVWTDPVFDSTVPAYYYARVVQDPTCRWSTLQCNALPDAQADMLPGCADDIPKTIQERAWGAPVWYVP
jgi:hypothetical protein